MTVESVVITVPPGTARLYLSPVARVKMGRHSLDVEMKNTPPERVWVGVPELPTAQVPCPACRGRDGADDPDCYICRGFGFLDERSLGPGDPVVLAERCDACKGDGTAEWPGDNPTPCLSCDVGLVRLVSARVADDDQPAIVPVGEDLDGSPDPTRPGRFVTTYVDHDGTLWSEIGDEMDMIEELPGDWSGMSFAVRVAGAEDYQP